MKRKLLTAVIALASCAGTQLFAQNVKEGVITFALPETYQTSVSTSTRANQGSWSQRPGYYKTAQRKVTERTILDCIGQVMHGSPNYYTRTATSTKPAARLVLSQGELGGFFNIVPDLADADTDLSYENENEGNADSTDFSRTIDGTFVRLATGRHFLAVPEGYATEGNWPPGHHQPWGQIFVKDTQRGICDNVTFFFAITVQECYDCFYLNSFVTDTKFVIKPGGDQQDGPPCCSVFVAEQLSGSGLDRYYMSLSFDNTFNNPYLNDENEAWIGVEYGPYPGVRGYLKEELTGDGTTPDQLLYVDRIISNQGRPAPYAMRFTLNGILTYKWKLAKINSTDLVLDFIQYSSSTPASYTANGYSFHALTCGLLTGGMKINETVVNSDRTFCCANDPWYESWYGVGWNNQQHPWSEYWESPVNVPASLSLHVGVNEFYQPRWQWPQDSPEASPALPDETVENLRGDGETYIPGTRWYFIDSGWVEKK